MSEELLKEIEEYVQLAIVNHETSLEMSDSPIGGGGAQAIAAALSFLESLREIYVSNCEITDKGACVLFDEL